MESIIQENRAILSVYAPNYRIWIKMKQKLMVLQEKNSKSTIIDNAGPERRELIYPTWVNLKGIILSNK